MSLTLFLSKALLCVASQCWPVLVGKDTPPPGIYPVVQRLTEDPGYGGDVLQFHEDSKTVYAIHRLWTLNPKEKRAARLADPNPKNRIITNGCVNIDPLVYNYLAVNYRNSVLEIIE